MADYGLKIWDAEGTPTLDTTDTITRLRYSTIAAADEDGDVTLADIDGKLTVQFAVSLDEGNFKCSHKVTRTGTLIEWEAQEIGIFESIDSLIVVFLYS